MAHSHGLTTSTWSVPKCPATSIFFAISLSQPLLLFLKSYNLPLLHYCDIVWSKCTKSKASRLEILLNYACCTVLHKRRRSYASSARRELGIFTLASRRKLHLALIMFNCMYSKSLPYFSQLFPLTSSHYNTRSALSSQLNLPPNRSSFGRKSFSFIAKHCGDTCHRTFGTPVASTAINHFASNSL